MRLNSRERLDLRAETPRGPGRRSKWVALCLSATLWFGGVGRCVAAPLPSAPIITVTAPAPMAAASPEARGTRKVMVRHIEVSGNTLIDPKVLDAIIAPYQNREVSFGELKDLTARLNEVYRRKGYLLAKVFVPRQDLSTGEVKLRVLEGRIGKITVVGNKHYKTKLIEEYLQPVTRGTFQAEKFARALLLLNDLPDLSARAVLKPGAEQGVADIEVQVTDKTSFHAGLDYNNFGVVETGENRVGLTVEGGNLTGTGDLAVVRGVIGFPSNDTNDVSADYYLPVDHNGTRIHAGYVNGAFAVGGALDALGVRGRSEVVALGASNGLVRTLDDTGDGWIELANKDVTETQHGAQIVHDHYTMLTLGYAADFRDVDGHTLLRAAVGQGLGGTSSGDPLNSHAGASGGFTKINVDFGRVQTLSKNFYFVFRGATQVAFQPLYISEQFPVGGPDSVRGYKLGEALGDSAYTLSAELRYSFLHKNPEALQLVGFIDNGTAYLKQAPFGIKSTQTLTGAGFGFRSDLGEHVKLRLDIGFPLSPSTNVSNTSPVLYGQVITRF